MMKKDDMRALEKKSHEMVELDSPRKTTWCSNCGNYAIQNALKRALVLENLHRQDYVLCFDIGCNGNGSDKIEAYTIHGLHGRVISLAAGAKIANHKLKIIASGGDSATFSEGVNHLVHGVRNDYPMLFIHHNNENYGLTTGQASALTPKGLKMNAAPAGTVVGPINSLDFVLSLNATFVARSYSGDVDHMTEMLRLALHHNGFAFVEILQACPTYNRATPDEWYAQHVADVATLPGYDPADIWQARKAVQFGQEKVYTGLIYRKPHENDFISLQPQRGASADGVPTLTTALTEEVKHYDITPLIRNLNN